MKWINNIQISIKYLFYIHKYSQKKSKKKIILKVLKKSEFIMNSLHFEIR